MNSAFEAKLIEALDAAEAGEPIEEILLRYPEAAAELRPILETSAQLSELPLAYSVSAQTSSKNAFLEKGAALKAQRQQSPAGAVPLWRRLTASFTYLAVSLALFVLLLGGLVTTAAQESLPGQSLYPVKRLVEDVRLSLAAGPARERLEARFALERRAEIQALLAAGLEATVSCDGTLSSFDEGSWTVDGLVIEIEAETVIHGQPAVGAAVRGRCAVGGGRVVARRLEVVSRTGVEPEPTATITATPSPSPTSTPSPSATETATPTPSPTTPTPEPTAALVLTSEPVPTTDVGTLDDGSTDDEDEDDSGEEQDDGEDSPEDDDGSEHEPGDDDPGDGEDEGDESDEEEPDEDEPDEDEPEEGESDDDEPEDDEDRSHEDDHDESGTGETDAGEGD